MSILIKGMEMPENCGECRFGYDGKCFATQPFTRFYIGDDKQCPLIEILPHGDLVDKQRMAETNEQHYQIYKGEENADYARKVVLRMLDQAPTIIEAEEGE